MLLAATTFDLAKMPTTEITSVYVSAGNEKLGDPSNDGAKILAQTAQTLLNAKGCQSVQMGNVIEDAQIIRWFIEWDDLAAQKAFTASAAYETFLQNVKPILASKPVILHVDFDSQEDFHATLAAPLTELVVFYFDGVILPEFAAGLTRVKSGFLASKGCRGYAWGPTHEVDIEHEGFRGQAAVVMIGWNSIEDHMAVPKSPLFKETGPLLELGTKKTQMDHIKAMPVLKD